MKILAIGDIHGRKKWELLQKEEADKIIIIGDYFDHFTITQNQIKNFEKILNWKASDPNKVELLFGNHDYHYLVKGRVQHTGYNPNALISQLLIDAVKSDLLKIFYIHDNFLFSHAGITNTYLSYLNDDGFTMEDLNDILKYKEMLLEFGYYGGKDQSGNDPSQGPLWVRPNSLIGDLIPKYTQIVGHTVQHNIKIYDRLIIIDSPMSNEVLEIDDGVVKIKELKNENF
jgi:predicted phosphodiesterase